MDDDDLNLVFKALADPTRRQLLDRLHEHNGQTLGELCGSLVMARQSATQHLAVLEAANLISTAWRGREKLHYLNPVPLHDDPGAVDRQVRTPATARAQRDPALAEEQAMTDQPTYVYVTYIEASPEQVWQALTDADLTAGYWGHRNESDWQPGSTWEHRAHRRLGHRRRHRHGARGAAARAAGDDLPGLRRAARGPSRSLHIEPHGEIVRLTVPHEDLPTQGDYEAISGGWPAVMANLKSLLETGHVLPQAPWEMHAALRDAQMAANDPR